MAEKQLNTIIVLRNDKSTDWATSEVILKEGEVGVSYLDNGNVVVKAGDGEHKWPQLKQVEGVFEEAVTLTKDFGYFTVPAGGSKKFDGQNNTINTKGMTTTEFLMAAFKKTIKPTIKRYPNASLTASCSNTGKDLEIGSYITSVSYTGSLSEDGDYETAGKETASGIQKSDLSWKVTLGDNADTEQHPSYNTSSKNYKGSYTTNIQINSTTANTVYATVKATANLSLDNVVIPTDNLGDPVNTVKIQGFDAAGTLEKNLTADVKASGYRNTWYYVGTEHTFDLTSVNIRDKFTPKNANTTSFGTVTIPANTTRVAFAVLGDKTLKSVIDVDGQNLDVKANFTKETIAIEGANGFEAANYSVFHFENPNGVAATKYTVTIG